MPAARYRHWLKAPSRASEHQPAEQHDDRLEGDRDLRERQVDAELRRRGR